MPRKPPVKADARLEIRLDAALLDAIQKRAKALGHSSTGEYIRSVVKRDLGRRTETGTAADLDFEKVLAANQNQVLGSLKKLHLGQRATMAFLFAHAKAVFKYLPELPPADAQPSDRRAEQRYRFVEKEAAKARFDLLDLFEAEMERREEERRPKPAQV